MSFALLLVATLVTAVSCKPKSADINTQAAAASPAPAARTAPPSSTAAYHCDGLDLTATYDADQVTIDMPGREYTLPHVVSADGAKYHNDKGTFWSKGDHAIVEIDGKPYTNCRQRTAADAPPGP
ncbi:lysozyme inhibitor [Solimonas sp. C16B3]|uniref:Lysozyme inhibitor n=2 Tax=Solimonas marina TaxID=2714601 RepID=A0A970B529_9GAMM|nr:lysozyme inhibitor [Solimonas marina]